MILAFGLRVLVGRDGNWRDFWSLLEGGSRCLSGISYPIIITEGPSPVCCPSLSLSNCNTFTLLQIRKQMRGLVIVSRVLTSGNKESMPSEKSSFRV